MKFAVNHSPQALALLKSGQVQFDLVKLPAWPDLVEKIAARHPCYVHLPLKAGSGQGVLDNETKSPVIWEKFVPMLEQTRTPLVNLHISLKPRDYPEIPADSRAREHLDIATQKAIQDVAAAVERFGPQNVIIENEHDGKGRGMQINMLPELYHRIIEATGCGFLLDVSHARIAARALGMDERKYILALPVEHIREIHLTGIQWFGEKHIEKVRRAGMEEKRVQRLAHHWMDHLPMTDNDWRFTRWVLERVRGGEWGHPWVAAFEYGGVGPFFGTFTNETVLREQIPRLYKMIHMGCRRVDRMA